ncbi:hypothetical protein [Nocardia sp. GTS18]|uniref:hypothetical protein n=1 Tax=Nocardia sp. GTS18 TaxID=1778064 RepID=UPI0015EF7487|nr:hypothetical protein [Nocardia sp. GTS18]
MARKPKCQYDVTAQLALGWGNNPNCAAKGMWLPTREKADEHAAELVSEMRQGGASTALRTVRMQLRVDSKLSGDALYTASYYDPEQGLTDAEEYAARVHDWHVSADRFNSNMSRNNGKYRVGYLAWSCDWGAKPISCPACGTVVEPQPMF